MDGIILAKMSFQALIEVFHKIYNYKLTIIELFRLSVSLGFEHRYALVTPILWIHYQKIETTKSNNEFKNDFV